MSRMWLKAEHEEDPLNLEDEDDGSPSMTPLLVYGIVADCLIIIPAIIYLVAGGTSAHSLMVEAIYISWMPFASIWILAMIDDGPVVREALKGALSMAGLGPWSTQWAGWVSFVMKSKDGLSTGGWGWNGILWSILYPCINIGLIALEWHMGAGVINWIENAPHGKLEEAIDGEAEDAEEEASELHTEW